MNKALWTSSFVLFTGGLAMTTLALSYWLIDVNGRQKYIEPFVAFGSNAIIIYVVSGYLPEMIGAIHVTDGGQPSNAWQYGSSSFRIMAYSYQCFAGKCTRVCCPANYTNDHHVPEKDFHPGIIRL